MPRITKAQLNVRRFLESAASPWLLGLLTFLVSLPRLATNPQTGDGAELVLTALHGGILHPPGFPLQSWVQRLFIHLPFSTPSFRISLISLIAHSVTTTFIYKIGQVLNLSPVSRVLSSLLFATTLSLWYLGVQPEVFSLTYLLGAVILYLTLQVLRDPDADSDTDSWSKSLSRFGLIGIFFGLGLSQHLIIAVFTPCLIALCHLIFCQRNRKWKWVSAISLILPVALVSSLFYLSLPLLSSSSLWPNWGNLRSASAIAHHLIRSEYGVFSLTAQGGQKAISGLELFLVALVQDWGVTALLLVPGVWLGLKRFPGRVGFTIASIQALGLFFLWRAGVFILNDYSESILTRFLGIAFLPAVLFFGIAIDSIESFLTQDRMRHVFSFTILLLLAARVPTHLTAINLRDNDIIETYRAALFGSIPPKTVVFAGSDIEVFYGIYDEKQKRTVFPIAPGLLNLPWYRERTLSQLIHGIRIPPTWTTEESKTLVNFIWKQGSGVACLQPEILGIPTAHTERRGLLLVSWGPFGGFSQESSKSVVALCPYVRRLRSVPKLGRSIDHAVLGFFVDAFIEAAKYHTDRKQPNLAESFWKVAHSLSDGTDSESWSRQCDLLEQEYHAIH